MTPLDSPNQLHRDITTVTGPTSQTPICWIDGEWTTLEAYGLTVATQGLHYGTGVFEGIRSYWSQRDNCSYIIRLAEHVDRLLDSCRLIRVDLGVSAVEMRDIVAETVARNRFAGDLYIRPIAFKSHLAEGTPFGVGLHGVKDITAVYAVPMPSRERIDGIRCGISSWRRVPADCIPARAKVTGSYVNIALAVDEARAAGFDDAILLNTRGTVAEASTANVFVISRAELATPSVDCDILAGLTRACVVEIAHDLGVRTAERPVGVAELLTADEVFLTGTGREITAVVEVNGRPIGTGLPGPITTAIFEAYRAHVHRDLDRHRSWTTAVPVGDASSPTRPLSDG